MKLLGIASFFLAVLCVCTVGEDGVSTSTVSSTIAASTTKSVPTAVSTTVSQATTVQTSVLPQVVKTTASQSTRSNPTTSSPSATHHTTQATTTRPPVRAATTSADKGVSTTTNTTQASGTQTAHKESLDVSTTKGWSSSSTTSLQKNTSASGTSGPGVTSPTESTNLTSASSGSSSENKKVPGSEIHYSSVILPVVITLIVITLSVFSLVALYRMCQKKTPERQENGTEQAQSDKEGVKLLSVKTTSSETGSTRMPLGAGEEAQALGRKPETSSQKRIPSQQRDRSICDVSVTGFSLPSANLSDPTTPPPSGEVSQGSTTGEHSSQGKNKTRQLFTPQQ